MHGMHFPDLGGALRRCSVIAAGWMAAVLKLAMLRRLYGLERPWDAWACMVTAGTLTTALRDVGLMDQKSQPATLALRAGVVGGLMLQHRRAPVVLLVLSWVATRAIEAARARGGVGSGGRAGLVF